MTFLVPPGISIKGTVTRDFLKFFSLSTIRGYLEPFLFLRFSRSYCSFKITPRPPALYFREWIRNNKVRTLFKTWTIWISFSSLVHLNDIILLIHISTRLACTLRSRSQKKGFRLQYFLNDIILIYHLNAVLFFCKLQTVPLTM